MLTKFARASAIVVGAFTVVLGLFAGLSGLAHASSFECVTSVGCGTLHTTIGFGGGTTVAMDAKYQKATEMVIGYPDLARDKATSFDKVAHTFGDSTYYTFVYAPNGDWSNACVTDVGDGDLALRPCTLGHRLGQRFYAYDVTTDPTFTTPVVIHNTDTRHFAIRGDAGFMADTSGSNPTVAQPDSSDNRQLTLVSLTGDETPATWTWGT
jgi:hypothetical protein